MYLLIITNIYEGGCEKYTFSTLKDAENAKEIAERFDIYSELKCEIIAL